MSGAALPRHWAFIAGRPFLPEGADPFAAGLGGTEQAVIHLGEALAELGHRVTVVGGACSDRAVHGVAWRRAMPTDADVHVAINDARLLPHGDALPMVWFHNEVAFGKELRRGRLPALLRHRPVAVFIGGEQARLASRLLPFRRRVVIPYGLSARVLDAPIAETPPPPDALFTSQAYRGLKEVIGAWRRDVAPDVPGARLTALIAPADVPTYRAPAGDAGITILERVGQDEVLGRLARTRVLLAPGHVSETFCLAAAEAIALGVPVVTLGIGSLKERVRDGVDGFVCRDYAAFAAKTRELLTDDALWTRMHSAGLATRDGQRWPERATAWHRLPAR